jgi:hypothetical protein
MPQVRLNAKGNGCTRDVIIASGRSELAVRNASDQAERWARPLMLEVHGTRLRSSVSLGNPNLCCGALTGYRLVRDSTA